MSIPFNKVTKEEFLNRLYDKYKDEYTYISGYKSMTNGKIKIRHNKCNNIYEVLPNNLLNNNRKCPYCSKNKKVTLDDFLDRLYNKYGNRYEYISEYKNMKSGKDNKVKLKCNICNNIIEINPDNLLNMLIILSFFSVFLSTFICSSLCKTYCVNHFKNS